MTGGVRPVEFGHKKESVFCIFLWYCGSRHSFVPATYLQLQGRHLLEKKTD